ncbi:MAG: rRNA maturation RNase YbeY [Desulfobacterota bacterium]|nr:rRNA maturation RNase YbeY [Thermodesulfobacteriota bacterium]
MALQNHELSILLLDDRRIAALNYRYLHRTGPTDVLSFPMHDAQRPTIQPTLLGDVVVSVETALRQAQECGITLEEEIARLLIHGILHLIGYDHETCRKDARTMRRREQTVFKHIKHLLTG